MDSATPSKFPLAAPATEEILDAEFRAPAEALPSLKERVNHAIEQAREFGRLKGALLDAESHIVKVEGKDRVNAAGWDVLAAALGVSVFILSQGADGKPGARREVMDERIVQRGEGRSKRMEVVEEKVVAYTVTVRAQTGDRVIEMTGSCDSTETKHAQYRHKMEAVAYTRAKNRAVCAIVGGTPGDLHPEDSGDYTPAEPERPAPSFASLRSRAATLGIAEDLPGFLEWASRVVPSIAEVGPGRRTALTTRETFALDDALTEMESP